MQHSALFTPDVAFFMLFCLLFSHKLVPLHALKEITEQFNVYYG